MCAPTLFHVAAPEDGRTPNCIVTAKIRREVSPTVDGGKCETNRLLLFREWAADRALNLRSFTQPEPIAVDRLADLDEFLEFNRLNQERVGAQLICQVYVDDCIGRGQHDDSQRLEFRLGFDPTNDVESIESRHLKIE